MTIRLSRNRIFLFCLFFILSAAAVSRLVILSHSSFAQGTVVNIKSWNEEYPGIATNDSYSNRRSDRLTTFIVQFSAGSETITFKVDDETELHMGDEVRVIYRTSDPSDAAIYSIGYFWLTPFIYALIPVLLIAAAAYSFLSANELLQISTRSWPMIGRIVIVSKK